VDDELTQVMDEMPYGLYIIGSKAGDEVNGMMADWVMQTSFHPRLVAVAFENDSRTLQNIRDSKVFTVNALAQDDDGMHLAAKFAQPYYGSKVKGRTRTALDEVHHKLEGIDHTKSTSGCPVLAAAAAWLDCEAQQFVDTGDHTLVVGEVKDGKLVRKDADPLTSTYTGWNYSG
jgi:flavin reductase (DIM6/NTAB) family NADH-FMN oxidoreductase RutF